jgi:predicted exporter
MRSKGWAEPGVLLTSFLPSHQRQELDAELVAGLVANEKEIAHHLEELGLPSASIQGFFNSIRRGPQVFLSPPAWLAHPASVGLRDFWLSDSEPAVVIQMRQVQEPGRLKAALSGLDGVQYFDPEDDLRVILAGYRVNATQLVIASYLSIFLILFWRYGRKGLAVVLPSLVSGIVTVGALGLLGIPFTLLHCLALLVVLGMVVDYSVFVAEGDPRADSTTFLSVSVCGITTLLSFGLLALSHEAALHTIGLTTVIGITTGWLVAPLAAHSRPNL